MSLPTIGDLSRSYAASLSMARLGRELTSLGREVTTGLAADVAARMQGDTAPLAAVERGLQRVSTQERTLAETRSLVAATQLGLERSQARIGAFAERALQVSSGGVGVAFDAVAAEARAGFEGMIADLNMQAGGIALFAGVATDGRATREAGAILADIAAAAAGAATPADLEAALDAYFAPGGAFESNDYLGAGQSRAPVQVAPGENVDFAPRADAAEIRAGLKALARVAVLGAGVLAGDPGARRAVMSAGIAEAMAARDGLVGLQALGGVAGERLDLAGTRAAAERGGLETARLDMISADPFEAATRLEQTRMQLESLYAVTARLSRLNLADYMR